MFVCSTGNHRMPVQFSWKSHEWQHFGKADTAFISDKVLSNQLLVHYFFFFFFDWSSHPGIVKAYPILPQPFQEQNKVFHQQRKCRRKYTLDVQGNFGLLFLPIIKWTAALPFSDFLVSPKLEVGKGNPSVVAWVVSELRGCREQLRLSNWTQELRKGRE